MIAVPTLSPSLPSVDDDVTVLEGAPATGAGDGPDEPEPEVPRTLGRYAILDVLGEGGMGRVYRAYDPELEREVAVKLLRRVTPDARARLWREAQAMAALCHPNVLPVYDVADDGHRMFIAMELVRGASLRQWLDDRPRPWTKVLDVLVAAGRGLRAAHEAGLVHRDFKPGNVLLGDDGRVRVMDFGLARGAGQGSGSSIVELSGGGSLPDDDSHRAAPHDVASSLSDDLTQAGVVVGTPAYMAPEQHVGHPASPRCDQYGLCVTLWEALFGRRPFEAESVADWYHVKTTKTPRARPERGVPAWLVAVVLRGLSPTAADRFPSMTELLQALEQGTKRRRGRRTLGLALAGLAVVGGGAGLALPGSQGLCAGAEDKLAGIWDEPTAAAVERAVLASGRAYAPDTWARMGPRLDGYAARWQAAHQDACEATHVRKQQPEALMDARMRCLEDRRRDLRALVGTLREAAGAVVERAAAAVDALPPVEPCADPAYVLAQGLPPADPEAAAAAEVLEDELARLKALADAGQHAEVEPDARAAVAHAQALGLPALEARARFRLGAVQDDLGRYDDSVSQLEQAYFIAQREGLDELQARAAVLLVHVVGSKQSRPAEGEQWARFAKAALERTHDPDIEASYLSNAGLLALGREDHALALDLLERARALREQHLGPEHPEIATVLNNLALAHDAAGRFDQAMAIHERALVIREQALGPVHPEVGSSLVNLATVAQLLGDHARAEALLLRAKALFEAAYGPRHPMVATALVDLGNVYEDMGQPARALERYLEALPILELTQGPHHVNVIGTLVNLGNVYRALDQRPRAREHYERALDLLGKTQGHDFVHAIVLANMGSLAFDAHALPEAEAHALGGLELVAATAGLQHPLAALLQANLAEVRSAQGRHDDAVTLHRQALEVRRALLGPRHLDTAASLALLGRAELEAGAPLEAINPLEQACSILAGDGEALGSDQAASLHEATFWLGRARWDAGTAHDDARATVAAARDALGDLPGEHDEALGEMDAWLAAHPPARHRPAPR